MGGTHTHTCAYGSQRTSLGVIPQTSSTHAPSFETGALEFSMYARPWASELPVTDCSAGGDKLMPPHPTFYITAGDWTQVSVVVIFFPWGSFVFSYMDCFVFPVWGRVLLFNRAWIWAIFLQQPIYFICAWVCMQLPNPVCLDFNLRVFFTYK